MADNKERLLWELIEMQNVNLRHVLDTNKNYYELLIALIELQNTVRHAAENASSDEARAAYNDVQSHIECLL